jgi:BirA family transcriptional regulator, biotin operon repressor / biotin---[acetyl-CoA-carboxylase] ligase
MSSNFSTKPWIIGCERHHLPSCQSTNEEIASRALLGAVEGLVISADEQTAGKGQRGTQWQASPGLNVTASILLRPTFLSVREQFKLSVASALATLMAIQKLAPSENVKIKWPNDLLINGKKVAGILIENHLKGQQIAWTAVGIGINVNQREFPGSEAYNLSPSSLSIVLGADQDLIRCLNTLLKSMDAMYLRLRAGQFPTLLSEYYAALEGYQEERSYRQPDGQTFLGTIKGVDEAGRLKVLVDNQLQIFDLKEISLLMPEESV